MEFRLLGPVEVVASEQPVDVGPPQRCAVLAALAVDAGRPVPVETLIDRIWGDQPPGLVRRAVHAHVTRIRRLLELVAAVDEPPARLLRRPGGYLLDVDPDRVDLHRFRRLLDQAQRPGRADADRLRLLREALGLWRGEPLAGLTGRWATRTRQGWRQQQLDAILAWAPAELRAGSPTAVIGRLTELMDEHPYLEPLVGALMRALYQEGRCAEALDLYQATRERLVADLGTEPGAELRRTHQAILRDELDGPDPRAPAPSPTPAQLPRDVPGFTGRREELARLDGLLSTVGGQGSPVVISAVAGGAGVGKTTLAVHWAHRVRERFPDGQLYVNLRGFDPGGQVTDPADAVRRFLDVLGVPPPRIPTDLDARAALYRSLLADRRMLVVLDNARDAAQVRPLLPGNPTCLVLVTSRHQLTGLVAADGAQPITLDLLSAAESRELLTHRLGPARLAAEPDAIDLIITHCAGLPLALTIVAARAATAPHLPLRTLAGQLRDSLDRLDALSTDDPTTDVRAVFSWSYRALDAATARLFRLLGLHPGPDISAAAAASLAAVSPAELRPLLAGLAGANLIIEHSPARFSFHDLLRAYATDLVRGTEPQEHRLAAVHRMLDHYLHAGRTAALLLQPHREPIILGPAQPGVFAETLADHDRALAWFAAEHGVLLAVVDLAAGRGMDLYTSQLAWTLANYLYRQGHWQDQVATGQAALAAVQRLAGPSAQALCHRNLARAYTRLGRHENAHTHLEHALDLYARAGDDVGQAHTHRTLGMAAMSRGRHAEALDHARLALALSEAAGHQRGQADALNLVGRLDAQLHDRDRGLTYCRRALALHQRLGSRTGQAAAWENLGYIHHHQFGHQDHAVACYRHALDLYRDLGDHYQQAAILTALGDAHHTDGDHDAARGAWRLALAILDDLGHPDAARVRTRLAT